MYENLTIYTTTFKLHLGLLFGCVFDQPSSLLEETAHTTVVKITNGELSLTESRFIRAPSVAEPRRWGPIFCKPCFCIPV